LPFLLAGIPCYYSNDGFLGEVSFMKSFVIACLAAVVVAIISGVVLNNLNESAAEAFSTTAVRLGA